MGQAKNRGTQEQRIAQASANKLGSNPFEIAYDAVFGMVQEVYRQTGGINHQLMGIEFKDGKIARVNSLPIDAENINRLSENLQLMLTKWPVVVHVAEAWQAPDEGVPASKHPGRKDIISITIHGEEVAASASCEVNLATRQVKKGPLHPVNKIEGRFARPLAVKH